MSIKKNRKFTKNYKNLVKTKGLDFKEPSNSIFYNFTKKKDKPSKQLKQELNRFKKNQEKKPLKPKNKTFKDFLIYLVTLPLIAVLLPFKKAYQLVTGLVLVRQSFLKIVFVVIFCGVLFRFAQLQIVGADSRFFMQPASTVSSGEIVIARRGQIYIQDQGQNRVNIPLTSTQLQVDIFADAYALRTQIEKGVSLQELTLETASRLNLNYEELYNLLKSEIEKETQSRHVVLKKDVNEQQRNIVLYLRESELNKTYRFQSWLGLTEKQTRSYPFNKFMASTIGYVPPYRESSTEIRSRIKSCLPMVEANISRGTDRGEYMVGFYGLEQKFCAQMGGVNGLRQFGFNGDGEEKEVINGADIYLTIDKNIQERAEQILEQTIINQTNSVGPPKDGTILVVEAKTGKIRALASWPTYDPNNYQRYWLEKPESFRNVATNVDYDIGSVMKPITVAAALNLYQSGTVDNGNRKGVPPEYGFRDYDNKGKPYTERNGQILYIQNSEGFSYKGMGTLGLKEIIRDSINTGIADVVDETGAKYLKNYFEEKFKFGKPTAVSLPGDEHGNIINFEKDIGCAYCYASFGFGQGFTASPLQVVRAYTPIANEGFLVEPYLVEKIVNSDGSVDDGTSVASPIYKEKPQQVLTPATARLVTSYMQAVIEEGYLGKEPSKAAVPGYQIAAKTGTSEVNRPYLKTDASGNPVLDENSNPVMVPCDYTCNRLRGRYDQTFIGFGPVRDPAYIVMIKLSEPNPGQVRNFSATTLSQPFSQMMEFSLTYSGIKRDF